MSQKDGKLQVKEQVRKFFIYSMGIVNGSNIPLTIKYSIGEELMKLFMSLYNDVVLSIRKVYEVPDAIRNQGDKVIMTWRKQKIQESRKIMDRAIDTFSSIKATWEILLELEGLKKHTLPVYTQEAEIGKILAGWREFLWRS